MFQVGQTLEIEVHRGGGYDEDSIHRGGGWVVERATVTGLLEAGALSSTVLQLADGSSQIISATPEGVAASGFPVRRAIVVK